MSAASLIAAQHDFTTHLPAVENAVRWAFRHWRGLRQQDYEEALAEARAAAWSAWCGLLSRGKDPVQVGVHAIANNAVRYVLHGRKVANRSGGRGAMDVYHRKAQAACGFKITSLDGNGQPAGKTTSGWREWIVSDNRCTPAAEAAFRLDFSAWLASLPRRRRLTAELLAQGYGTLEVARAVGISAAAVSQARSWLAESWRRFQGEGILATE
jgi:hypothetical protein